MKYILLTILTIGVVSATYSQADSADYYLQKGLKEKEAGRKMEVWKNLDKAYKFSPDNKVIISELASALLELRRYGLAIDLFKKMEQQGDHSAALYKQLFTLTYNSRQFDEAVIYAGKLKAADANEKVNYQLGKIYYDKDDYGQAIQYLKQAEKEEPQNAEVHYLLARCYADMNNFKTSAPYFEKAITLDPSKNNWMYEYGLICYAMSADKDALKYILMAGEKGYKKDDDYMENLAIAYLNVGNMPEALKIFNDILQKKPSDLNILNMIAEAYYYNGKYQEAINYWDKILAYDKNNAQSLYMIGMSYQKKGEKDKGIALCDKAIQMDPSLSLYKQKKMNMGL